jgi:hypothetical protein
MPLPRNRAVIVSIRGSRGRRPLMSGGLRAGTAAGARAPGSSAIDREPAHIEEFEPPRDEIRTGRGGHRGDAGRGKFRRQPVPHGVSGTSGANGSRSESASGRRLGDPEDGAIGERCHAADAAELRVLRPRSARRPSRRIHLFVRVHLLRRLRDAPLGRDLSELPRFPHGAAAAACVQVRQIPTVEGPRAQTGGLPLTAAQRGGRDASGSRSASVAGGRRGDLSIDSTRPSSIA